MGAAAPRLAARIYIYTLYIRNTPMFGCLVKKIGRGKMSFKFVQIFFRESLGTPLDEKNVSGRIYTYPTTFVEN